MAKVEAKPDAREGEEVDDSHEEVRDLLIEQARDEDKTNTYWEAMYNPDDGRPSARATELVRGEECVFGEVRLVERIYGCERIRESVDDMFADRVSWNREGRREAKNVLSPPPTYSGLPPPPPAAIAPVRRNRFLSRAPFFGRLFQ